MIIGSRPGVIESSLHVLLQVPQYIPKEEKFDLMLLVNSLGSLYSLIYEAILFFLLSLIFVYRR